MLLLISAFEDLQISWRELGGGAAHATWRCKKPRVRREEKPRVRRFFARVGLVEMQDPSRACDVWELVWWRCKIPSSPEPRFKEWFCCRAVRPGA